jgi:hypothetical protein
MVEAKRDRMEMDKNDALKRQCPDPTIFYEIGQRVRYGNWDWSAILESVENGRVYKLFSVTWNTGRNVPDHSSFKIHYLPWYDFQPYVSSEENATREKFEQDDDIFFQYMQRDMSGLLNYYFQRHGIDLEPEYQRGNVWTIEQKRALIDSIFRNVDIGKIAIIKRPWGDIPNTPATPKLYEMLDGKQRMTALVEYFTGQFDYRGKYFRDLCLSDQNHFKHYTVAVAETNPLTNEQKYRYFLKLNTTGTPVDEAHMEKVAGMLKEEIEKNAR